MTDCKFQRTPTIFMHKIAGNAPINAVRILSIRKIRHKRENWFDQDRIVTDEIGNFLFKWLGIGKYRRPKPGGYFSAPKIQVRFSGVSEDYNMYDFPSEAARDREFARLETLLDEIERGLV